MLPIKLEIQAFGPYVEKQVIHFKDFEQNKLFLIEGETGSGKTVILDAITYALYGKSSGGQREDIESMRSRFALDDNDTIVSFTFQSNGKVYQFKRMVKVHIRKKDQVRQWKTTCDCGELINDEFHPFFENPRLKNMEEKANELIGLSYTQFVQVMILPQGKFEQFLTSKSEDKQAILKTLFQMERWSDINQWLVDKVNDERKALEAKKQQVKTNLEMLSQASFDEANACLETLRNELMQQKQQLQEALVVYKQKQDEVAIQKQYHEWKRELQIKTKKLEELASQENNMKKLSEDVKHYQTLHEILPIHQAMQTLTKSHDDHYQALERAKINYSKATELFKQETTINDEIKQINKKLNELENDIEKGKEQFALIREFSTIKKQWQTAQTEKQDIESKMNYVHSKKERLHNELRELEQQVTVLQNDQFKRDEIKQQYHLYELSKPRYDDYQTKLKDIEKQELQITKYNDQYQVSIIQRKTCEEKHEVYYQAFLEDSALQLAQSLEEGKPCPVCGSIHHPTPATLRNTIVDVMKLKNLKQALDDAKKAETKAAQMLEGAKIKKEGIVSQANDLAKMIQDMIHKDFEQKDYDDIQNLNRQAQKEEDLLQANQKSIEVKNKDIQNLQKQLDDLQTAFTNSLSTCATLQANCDEKAKLLPEMDEAKLKQSIVVNEKEQASLQTKQQKLQNQVEKIKQNYHTSKAVFEKCEEDYVQVHQTFERKQIEYHKTLTQYGITKEDMNQLPTLDKVKQLSDRIQDYYTTISKLEDDQQAFAKKLENIELKELSKLEEDVNTYFVNTQHLQEDISNKQSKCDLYQKTLAKIISLNEDVSKLEPVLIKRAHFVKAMRGDNGIGIERYVLGVLLDSITTQANQLLSYIHEGRYQIYRNDDTTGRTRKYGLELSIFDSYSMENRNVVSLSGGEKFLVSLAMSLALSMVVQARNGGIRFDCLFIDEGFGSLDEHSIADALAILQTMTQGKGMIGIISHVEILKENIQDGIEVAKTKEGSHIHIR